VKRCALALALLVMTAAPGLGAAASRIACSATQGKVWRQIDGKRCWYNGSHRIDKSLLYWPVAKQATKREPSPIETNLETRNQEPIAPEESSFTSRPDVDRILRDELLIKSFNDPALEGSVWPVLPVPEKKSKAAPPPQASNFLRNAVTFFLLIAFVISATAIIYTITKERRNET